LQFSGIDLDDSRLTYLAELTQLEELEISNMSLYDEDLANLSNLVNLKQLRFDSETVSQGGMAYLADLTSLEDLAPWVPMNDTGLSHLTNLDKLQRLQIKGNITEKGMNHLAKLKALRTLRITSGNDFSNASLEQLQKELPMLQRLYVAKDRKIKSPPKIGTLAPQFNVNTIDDKKIALEDYRGKVVLLYFWGTWCSPCVASTPGLKKLYEELNKYDDFVMISLGLDDDEFRLRRHVKKYKLN